jgi:hypothetical protein
MYMNHKKLKKLMMQPVIKMTLLRVAGVLFFIVQCQSLLAQSSGPGNPGVPGGDPGLIPVDGGLAFLVAAGLGYGAKKAYDFKRGIQKKNH